LKSSTAAIPNAAPTIEKTSVSAINQPMARQDQSMDSVAASNTPPSAAPEAFGTVAISSDPGGAEILVDDKFSGNTPAILKLPAGSHAILLKFPGHAATAAAHEKSSSAAKSLLGPVSNRSHEATASAGSFNRSRRYPWQPDLAVAFLLFARD
jgi:hypothetical protein